MGKTWVFNFCMLTHVSVTQSLGLQLINDLGIRQTADCNYCVNGLLLSEVPAMAAGHEQHFGGNYMNFRASERSICHTCKHPHTVCLYFLSWKSNVNKILLLLCWAFGVFFFRLMAEWWSNTWSQHFLWDTHDFNNHVPSSTSQSLTTFFITWIAWISLHNHSTGMQVFYPGMLESNPFDPGKAWVCIGKILCSNFTFEKLLLVPVD